MYIRTDEGHIYERIEQRIMKCVYCGGEQYRHNLNSKWENIIAQADTIEELCDEYVIPRYQDTFIVDRFSKQICLNHIKCGYGDVYGAIWTSKGLIYVAKMNDKGELELI